MTRPKSTLQLLFVVSTLAAIGSQTVDPSILVDIFGTPPPTTPPTGTTTQRLEDILVQSTTSPTTFVDENGDECKCVPYYLCDSNHTVITTDLEAATGWGRLDIRFGETHKCIESIEICCKTPLEPSAEPVTPTKPPAPLKGCGYANKGGLDFTVVGGSGMEAGFGEFPWVVALLDQKNNSRNIGVGVLIHPDVVMTGAHIAATYAPGDLKVRAGEWDTQTANERLPHQERIAREIVIHESYRPKNLKNDIALLRLDQPFVLDQHINVICMPEQDEDFDGHKNCIANGWGKSVFGLPGRYAVILKRVEVNMVPHWLCDLQLKKTRLGMYFKLDKSFVCAGGEEGKDTCQGDGGAPLACPTTDGRYKLTGLVAWGIGCGEKDVPAVYARVPSFVNWTKQKLATWGITLTN